VDGVCCGEERPAMAGLALLWKWLSFYLKEVEVVQVF
jgi:hypothetical protein